MDNILQKNQSKLYYSIIKEQERVLKVKRKVYSNLNNFYEACILLNAAEGVSSRLSKLALLVTQKPMEQADITELSNLMTAIGYEITKMDTYADTMTNS